MLPPINLLVPNLAATEPGTVTSGAMPADGSSFAAAFADLLELPPAMFRMPLPDGGTAPRADASAPVAGGDLPPGGNALPLEAIAAAFAGEPSKPIVPDDAPLPLDADTLEPSDPASAVPAIDAIDPAVVEGIQLEPRGGVPGTPASPASPAAGGETLPEHVAAWPAANAAAADVPLARSNAAQSRPAADAAPVGRTADGAELLPPQHPAHREERSDALLQKSAEAVLARPAAADAPAPNQVHEAKAFLPAAATPALGAYAAGSAQTPSSQPSTVPSGQPAIAVPPGEPGWGEALGERVVWMTGNKLHNAELRLNPAELGPVRVQISIDDGNATVNFHAQHAVTRDAIEQALPRLREMLAEQGLTMSGSSVTGQDARHEQSPEGQQATATVPEGGAPRQEVAGEELPAPALRRAVGLLDVFA